MSKIKIGLFGFGVVGQGIYQGVQKSKNDLRPRPGKAA